MKPGTLPLLRSLAGSLYTEAHRSGLSVVSEHGLSRFVHRWLVGASKRYRKLQFQAECKLGQRDRIDYLLPELRIGLELKTKGTLPEVARQLQRYAASDRIEGLVLVTTRAKHRDLPGTLSGVPIEVAYLGGVLA